MRKRRQRCTQTCCRTHIFSRCTPHSYMRAYTHGSRSNEKGVCSVYVVSLHLAFSTLMIHSLHCCSPTDTSTTSSRPSCAHRFCRAYADPQARVQRTSVPVRRSLATWPLCSTVQVMCPRSWTRWFLRMTRRPSTTLTTRASLTSRKLTRTLDGSVFLQCVKPVSQVSRGDIALQNDT